MNTIFCSVPVGTRFEYNGNVYTKVSTRTARLEEYDRVFYFGIKDNIRIMGQA